MNRPADGCARERSPGGAGEPGAPLEAATAEPVACRGCGNIFGRGAEAGTVCPYCSGPLRPLRGALDTPGGPGDRGT
jgi:hypothetical protein